MGEGVEEASEERCPGITQQAATQHAWGDLLAGDLAQGQEHPGGLDEDDHHHQAHGEDRGQVELRHAEVQRCDHLQPGRLGHAAEVDHTDQATEDVAQAHADQYRDVHPEAAHEAVDQQDGTQHQGGDGQVDGRAELGCAAAAACPVHRHGKQRETDRGDDRASDQRREEAHHLGHERRDQHAEETGGDGCAENSLHADAGHAGHGHHAAHRGEAGPHHHRHANAHGADAH